MGISTCRIANFQGKLKAVLHNLPQTMEEEDPVRDSLADQAITRKTQASISQDPQCRILSNVVSKLNPAMKRKKSALGARLRPGTEAWLSILKPVSITHITRLKKRNHRVLLQVTPKSL